MSNTAQFSVKESNGKVHLTVAGTTYRLSPASSALLAQKLSDASGEAIRNQSHGDNLRDLAGLLDRLKKK